MKMSSENASDTIVIPRAPQRRRGRERVTTLLTAATAVFTEKGYDAATMTEIAARAGGSIGSLYLFFPTKELLARALQADLAEALTRQLDALRDQVPGGSAADLAEALFGVLSDFLAAHPVYAVLSDLRGEDGWKQAMRVKRRGQIAALLARATPSLPPGRPELMAVIILHLMRAAIGLTGEAELPMRGTILAELRLMLRRHLEEP